MENTTDPSTAPLIETERLEIRRLTEDDAPFILDLLNQPSFLRFIGDRGVRTLDDARAYLRNGPLNSYARHGFGLYRVALKHDATPIGLCGLLRREWLEDVDLGYALFPAFEGHGYARESAQATLRYAFETLGLHRVVAITDPDNVASIRLLETLGFAFERRVRERDDSPDINLFAIALA